MKAQKTLVHAHFKPTIFVAGVLFLLVVYNTILILSHLTPYFYQHSFWQSPFPLDTIIMSIMLVVSFMIGYFATRNSRKLCRAFDGSVFLITYMWTYLLLSAFTVFFGVTTSTIPVMLSTNAVILIGLGIFASVVRRRSNQHTIAVYTTPFTLGFSLLYCIMALLVILSAISGSINNSPELSRFTFMGLLNAAGYVLPLVVGYFVLRHIRIIRLRLFLAALAASTFGLLSICLSNVISISTSRDDNWHTPAIIVASLVMSFTLLYFMRRK